MTVNIGKTTLVQSIKESYLGAKYLFILDYKGVNAKYMHDFRSDLRLNANSRFTILKNTLNKIALSDTKFDVLSSHLKGQLGVVFCEDPVIVAKVIEKFCSDKASGFKVAGVGDMSTHVYKMEYVKELASLPPVEIMKAKLLGMLNSVGSSLVRLLNEPTGAFVRVLNMQSSKN